MDSQSGAVKDKYLAGGAVVLLLLCYMALAVTGGDTKFIEGAFLIALGAFVGLLKQTQGQTVTGDIVERKDISLKE